MLIGHEQAKSFLALGWKWRGFDGGEVRPGYREVEVRYIVGILSTQPG